MIEILGIIGAFTSIGLLIYFRYTDTRNVTVQTLKDYLKQSEKHIEMMLRKKEKEFEDKMITSEIVIERMHRLSSVLQEKLELFDRDISVGQELFDALKDEINIVNTELYEYKQIRIEFKDVEDRISAILDIKQQAEDGTAELQILKQQMKSFSEEYYQITDDIKAHSKKDLEDFFDNMQQDLSKYLTQSKEQLVQKDTEMATQIQELEQASGTMVESIREFKEYAQNGIEQLKKSYEHDLEVAKSTTESNITDIYDMWNRVKDKTQKETDDTLSAINYQKEFFDNAEQNLRSEIERFNTHLSTLSAEIKTNLDLTIQDKFHELDTKIADVYTELENRGTEVQTQVEGALNSQTISIREKLDQLYAAFVEQEQAIEDRVRVLSSRVSEGLGLAENSFQSSLLELQTSLEETKNYTETVLHNSQEQVQEKILFLEESFKEKAQVNILKLEETLKENNEERIAQSITDITHSLESEFKQKYQENIEETLRNVEELHELVKNKTLYVEELDKHFAQMNETFNDEKEKIILMCGELEKDRESSTDSILQQVNEYMQVLQNDLASSVQEFFDQGTQDFTNSQESWKERYDEIVQEGREEYQRIKLDIDAIHHFISNIEDTSLVSLKREAEKIAHDAEYKIDDLKKYLNDALRNSKEDFLTQTDQAKQEIKDLKQELWNQEKEVQQTAQKDLDRLSNKVKEVDNQIAEFIKKANKLDNVEELIRKLKQQQEESNDLKKEIDQLILGLQESYNQGDNTVQQLYHFKIELEDRAEELNMKSLEADRMQGFLSSTIQEAENITQSFSTLAKEKEKAEALENLLLKNLETFNEVQDYLNQLESKRNTVENMMTDINNSEAKTNQIISSQGELNARIREIDVYAQEVNTTLGSLQKEMREFSGEQTIIRTAVSKLNDLDHMILHIDEEMKRLDKMRDWIAKSLNNVERIGLKTGAGSFNDKGEVDDANVKNVLRLYEKGWGINEIAKNLNITSAYIELIIERYSS